MRPDLEVCICTHMPVMETLEKVIDALTKQTLSKERFLVTVIDNSSTPPLQLDARPFLGSSGLRLRIIHEPELGVVHARIRGLKESQSDVVVFVDDDNVLAEDFLEQSLVILKDRPDVGCFSGKILLPNHIQVTDWMVPILPSLAIRNEGEADIVDWCAGPWTPWAPFATASMVIRRPVWEHFLEIYAKRKNISKFGRRGRVSYVSGEDTILMYCAAKVGLKCGYFPKLKMNHWVDVRRLTLFRLMRLMYGLGTSEVARDRFMGHEYETFTQQELYWRLLRNYDNVKLKSALCLLSYEIPYIVGRAISLARSGRRVIRWV